MKIDFSMSGINHLLMFGIIVLLQGFCFLIMQNPIKNFKKFKSRDFILFGIIICLIIAGLVCTVIGILNAANLLR